jgi:capsular exopolysaccharide synthesis family protein
MNAKVSAMPDANESPDDTLQETALTREPETSLAVRQAREPLLAGTDEVFRTIYTRAGIGPFSEVVAVSSALSGEGKTTLALGLAITIAQDAPERRVMLVEADVHHPALAQDFDVEATPGLLDYLADHQPIEAAIRTTYLENLDFMPAGAGVARTGRPLRSQRMVTVLDALRREYDLVILDLPAVLVNSDALLLYELADSAILVVRSGVTPAPIVQKAIEQIDEGKLRGVVLNASQSASPEWVRRLCGY